MEKPTLDFQAVHDRFRPRILRYLSRLLGPGEAEDLAQVVMWKVSESLAGCRADEALSTWVYRIATNVAFDRLRSRSFHAASRTEGLDEADAHRTHVPAARAPSPETDAIRGEMSACVWEYLERLPDHYKGVLVLSELEGFTDAEIGAILGLSVGTVKIRLHRARLKLRRELEHGCRLYHDERNELACDRRPS